MANLPQAAVTVQEVWKGGGTNGRKFLYKSVRVSFSTTSGGDTNRVLASLFGMREVWGASDIVDIDTSYNRYEARPNADRSALLFYTYNSQTPADISSVSAVILRMTVWGKD